jgi:hypothetical protein
MSLEFNKIVQQVQTMGQFLGHKDGSINAKLELALKLFYEADDLDFAHERIAKVRQSNSISYRGAVPHDEVICEVFDRPPMPPSGTVIAADGSQVYPDAHAPTQFYLVNIGWFACTYGEVRLPEQATEPQLVYKDSEINDADGRMVNNNTVNARRTVAEVKALATQAWLLRGEARPLVTLHDGGLLKFFGSAEITDAAKLEQEYMTQLRSLKDSHALLTGYLDRPRSTYILSLLHLLNLEPETISDVTMKTNGELEGLTDIYLMSRVLKPGQRSAIMTQNSPQNLTYKTLDPDFEIAYFYLNVSDDRHAAIARVDIPMWVARDLREVNDLHALILAQCAIQGRRHYPYALTRADELAYVGMAEKQQLNELINIELLKNRVERQQSDKLQTKGLARASRRQHKMGSR